MVILVGLRMGLGAVKMWRAGYLDKEFPRYQYQRILWKEEGKENTQLALQIDAISQGLANASFLSQPIFISFKYITAIRAIGDCWHSYLVAVVVNGVGSRFSKIRIS